jgi:hypothetical protein
MRGGLGGYAVSSSRPDRSHGTPVNSARLTGMMSLLPKRSCLRHVALNSSVERFQKFRRSGRRKSKADDLHTVREQFFE